MKLLIFACILGFAAADLLSAAAPAVDRTVLAFLEGASESGSLSGALGVENEPWLDEAGDDIQTELGKHLRDALNDLLEKIKDHLEHGKQVGKDMLEQVKELREKLKDVKIDVGNKGKELLEKIKAKAKEVFQKLLEKLGLGKRNIDHHMDSMARASFKDLLERVKQRILNNVHKIRDYVRNIASDSPLARKLKEVFEELKDEDLREMIRHIFDRKSGEIALRGETWEKIKNWFKDLNVKIQEHTKKFGEWLKKTWSKGSDKLKEKYGTIKAIALEFISHAKDTSAEVAREALEFFRPYQEDLGTLWKQIVDAANEAIGKF